MKLRRQLHERCRRWRDLNMALLRLFLRLVPSESHRIFAMALLVGLLCGLAALSFHFAIIRAEARLRRTAAEGGGAQEIATLVQTSPRMHPGDTLVRAIVRMENPALVDWAL